MFYYTVLLYHNFYCGERFIRCKDCDRLVRVNAKDHITCRCNECQHKEDNEKTKIRMKKYRN